MAREDRALLERLYYLCWAWSAYLDGRGEPFWITGNVVASSSEATFYVRTYRVLNDLEVRVGEGRHRARVITRLDSLNVVESYLGATSKDHDGAFLLVARVREFAVDHLWPMLDPQADEQESGRLGAFLAPLRREAGAQLPADDLAGLTDAVAALTAWLACGILIHEARHVADFPARQRVS